MSSSGNRFTPLAEASSSNEKNAPVPTTDTTDRTMQDVSEAGPSSTTPSLSMTDLKTTLPDTHAGRVDFVLKRFAQFEAEEQRKKLQESNASKRVTRPSPSADPSHLVRKRSVSSDEAEQPPKRRRLESVASSPKLEEPATSSSAAPPKGNPSAQGIVPFIDPTLVPWWDNIQTPEMPLPCIIQVNDSTRFGNFDDSTEKWTFQLSFHAGPQQSPAMTMKFFSNGVHKPQSGEIGWLLSGAHEDEWMVLDFQILCLADSPRKRRIHHNKIFRACRTVEERERLMCIRLEAWPRVIGHFNGQARKYFPDLFTGRRPYQLHIWFIAPYDVETFERQCLRFFTHYFRHRQSVHSTIPPL